MRDRVSPIVICRTTSFLFLLVVSIASPAGRSWSEQFPANSLPVTRADESQISGDSDDNVCRACHQEKVAGYWQTSHHKTSQLAGKLTIAGNFSAGHNVMKTSNPELSFRMEANQRGIFQTAISGVAPDTISRSERFDIVIGSGGKGQTYLYWKGDELFQLPVTYWTELGQWVNSPGYKDGTADFSRRIPPRCLDCHAGFFESNAPPLNRYRKSGFVLGISCQKCHGPGSAHTANPASPASKASSPLIVNPGRLSRERQMDLCALCHAGIGELKAPPFTYIAGESLDKYVDLPRYNTDTDIDVHGSQVELLRKSRCYQASATMTCSTCHNVHQVEHDLAVFSDRCLSCHKVEACGEYSKLGRNIARNCIDCHMPNQPTNLIVSDSNGRKVRPQVRSHWIKRYQADEGSSK
jgi:cytochrome c554/c'-like protein